MAAPLRWAIIYRDGSITSDLDCSPFEVPPTGVQVIVQHSDDVGRSRLANHDYYWLEDGHWLGGDLAGLIQYFTDYVGKPQKVILGKTVRDEVYHSCMRLADELTGFPAKSATNTEDRV